MDLLNLEQQRQALDTQLQQLRQSLKHWQMWEAEYEGLKEEITAVNDEPSASDLDHIAKTYDGDLVDEKEVREITGLEKDSPRSAKQIVGLIERRQEYVQKNIETVQRQFFDAEAKQEELAFAAAREGGSGGSEGGLPLTEIHEELDDEGNVISSHLTQPEETTAKVVESLRKAGLSDEDLEKTPGLKAKSSQDLKPAIINASPSLTPTPVSVEKRGNSDTALRSSPAGDGAFDDIEERPQIRKKSVSFTADTKAAPAKPRPESQDGRKSVSFAEKVAVMPAAPPPDNRSVSFSNKVEEIPAESLSPTSPDVQATNIESILKDVAEKPAQPDEAISLSREPEEMDMEAAIIPEDESPEDARTRREMLEYHLNEVGNVVAQIDLDEAANGTEDDDDGSYHTTSEYPEDDDTPYTTGLSDSEDDDEDEYGRTKRQMVSPEYRKQMEDLQNKLIGNIGPTPSSEALEEADPDVGVKDVRRLVIRDKRNSTSSMSSDSSEKKSASSKKRVSFAESLDVAEPGSPPLKAQKHQSGENVAPLSQTVLERSTASSHTLPPEYNKGVEKVSRFKKSRAAPITHEDHSTTTAPAPGTNKTTTPPGATMAPMLHERIPASSAVSAPSLDDAVMQRRELAEAYYRRRNDLIRQQPGGFRADEDEQEEEEEAGELMEERDGRLRKVSRFRAARLKASGLG